MKKTLALLLALLMLFSLAACGTAEPTPAPAVTEQPAATEAPAEEPAEEPTAETVTFTDSSGREIELPANITKIAPGGTVATMILAAFAPEKLVCVGTDLNENQIPYLYDGIAELPVTGQLYGGKATLNLEELLATGAEVIIDLGDFKSSIADDLTAIGEVGLTGEIRTVSHLNQRLGEVARLGFKKCIIPKGGSEKLDIPEGLTVYRVRNLREAIEVAL